MAEPAERQATQRAGATEEEKEKAEKAKKGKAARDTGKHAQRH